MDVPRRLGRYELLERVGEGSLGVLYRGRDTVLDREVAAKVMQAAFHGDQEAHARFFREAKAAARLQHVNIVTIFEFGEHEGTPYIVMEFLRGGTLGDRLRQRTPIGLTDALDIGMQMCAGLDAAHHQGVIHRAINPGNVWLCHDGTVKLLDFGIATAVASVTTISPSSRKAAYLSPEQVQGRDLDRRSDIFAVGAVLYEMLAGRRAFDGDSLTGVMRKIVTEDPEPIHSADQAWPGSLAVAVGRALAKAPDARFSTAAELLTQLRAIKAGLPPDVDSATVLLEPTVLDAARASEDETRRSWPTWIARLREPLTGWRISRTVAAWVAGTLLVVLAVVALRSLVSSGTSGSPEPVATPAPDSRPPADKAPLAAKPATATPLPVPAKPTPATLRITSQPSSARVSIDGRNTGQTTPAQLPLAEGHVPAAIQLDLPGYESARLAITGLMLREGRVDVTLVPRTPPKSLTLVAMGDYPFSVTDGGRVLSAMSERHDLDVSGLRSVQLRSDQYFLNQNVRLDPDNGGAVKVSAPPLGSISVYASGMLEDCKVYLDDRLVDAGSIPVAKRRVASGNHRVQLRCVRGDTDPHPVRIEANQDAAARFPKDTPVRPK